MYIFDTEDLVTFSEDLFIHSFITESSLELKTAIIYTVCSVGVYVMCE